MTRSYMVPVYGGDTTAVPRALAAKPRCEDVGFEHYWAYDNRLYLLACDPPQARRRTCRNCGRQEREVAVQKEVLEWRVVQDAEPTR